jgi:hypothetical protein
VAATFRTRLLGTAPAGLVLMLATLAGPPAALAGPPVATPPAGAPSAALPAARTAFTPQVVIDLPQKVFFDGAGPIVPVVRLTGASALPTGTYTFYRFAEPNCQGPKVEVGVKQARHAPVEGPDFNHGKLGRFGIGVAYSGDALNEKASACEPYALVKKSVVRAVLDRKEFDTVEDVKPAVTLAGTTGQPSGKVEFRRFGNGVCDGPPVVAGTADVSGSSVARSVNLQAGSLGELSFRVHYSGDEANAEALSECVAYKVGSFIRGRVYSDLDRDGRPGPQEPGIADVLLALSKDGARVADVKTDDKGEYSFFVTVAGAYLVFETQPLGFDSSTADQLAVTVPGQGSTGQDFGDTPPASAAPSESAVPEPSLVQAGVTSQQAKPLALTGTWLRIIVIALVTIALLAIIVLMIAARNRRDDDDLDQTRVDLDQTRRL